MKKLTRDFYNRDTLEVAGDLLGKYLVHEIGSQKLIGKIVEVEAYKGPGDKAAHSYGGKITERNKVMFGPPGYAYVFNIYGMYQCMNVVTEPEGNPCAVLIRAVEPVAGEDFMARNRYNKDYEALDKRSRINISNGPGKLCIALGIAMKHYGQDLCGDVLYITENDKNEEFYIATSPRINIDYAEEAMHFPWRFYIEGNKYVSKK
ncbi:MAG: DNA-3-methyladenine glycosylase [Petroclostridium sp.]|uniref:DNA-3-methyladenine glycosylase n=1 Tax=Petroclostridium xylanilyticum TaxID=1792311 RepID=UPI000B991606|nr:DNA-3-methyladenine glycosylase [Petroclostridium xylanilyticum]MDK2811318.1 DNA-3-methyladenine glycosylase [Petroclostridium sp.]